MAAMEKEGIWRTRFWQLFWGSLVLRFAMAFALDLSPDEAYYWELSRHLDLSYFDHPPMVAYFIGVFRALLGDVPLAVRLPALLSFSVVLWAVFQLGKEIPPFEESRPHANAGEKTGFFAALLLHATPAGVALGFITTPDSPLSLFWSLGALMFVRCLSSDEMKYWLGLGFCLGLGAMAKYNMIFFCPGVAAVILLFAPRRKLVFTGRFWAMFFLAFAGAIPVLLWNYQHDWISFRFQFNHGFRPSTRTLTENVGEYLGGQLGTIGPILYPVLIWAGLKNLFFGWKQRSEARFTYAALALPMMGFFTYTCLKSKVEANWPQVAYLTAMPLAADWIFSANPMGEKDSENPSATRRFRWTFFPSALLGLVAMVQAMTLVLPLPPSSDVSTRLHGWGPMGAAIQRIDRETGNTALFIGQGAPFTALVSFYGKLPPERIAEIHGIGNWKFWWKDRIIASNTRAVYVDTGDQSEVQGFLAKFFPDVISSQSHPIFSRGRNIRTIYFTHGQGYTGNLKFE